MGTSFFKILVHPDNKVSFNHYSNHPDNEVSFNHHSNHPDNKVSFNHNSNNVYLEQNAYPQIPVLITSNIISNNHIGQNIISGSVDNRLSHDKRQELT